MRDETFDELLEAVNEAAAYHRGAKLDLRTTVLPDPPLPVTQTAVKRLRNSIRVSQAVFARYLNVSTKLVQAWEGGHRRVDGPALTLLQIATHHPEIVFPISRSPSARRRATNGSTRTFAPATHRKRTQKRNGSQS
jgi:putative transcriptional regulator